jgi:hypothetical protein
VSDYADLAAFVALPRLTGLALSVDGARLVAVVQHPDRKGAQHVLGTPWTSSELL